MSNFNKTASSSAQILQSYEVWQQKDFLVEEDNRLVLGGKAISWGGGGEGREG